MEILTPRELQEAFHFVREKVDFPLQVGMVLGSGLGAFTDSMQKAISFPYRDIPHFPISTITGHAGFLHFGFVEGVSVGVMEGRFHYYEGHHPSRVVMGIRLLAALGIRTLIVTNAAGIINESYHPGEFMLIKDHINLTGNNPLIGPSFAEWGDKFVDMSQAYDPHLAQYARQAAHELQISLHEGVYCGLAGPSYETPAEIRMLRLLGADAVGMSTVYEVIVARQLHMRVLGISFLTNFGAGLSPKNLDHGEVLEIAQKEKVKFVALLQNILQKIDSE
ncbi:MAG: purine-nucleoside phosphorylase [Leptospiraceae bacterium]|nr:purine-nucleoside phosphorylase [Leptospiraceae bacterium]MDW8306436.1 purine-nucleoside phosphorylase [Leptospiraceae bacterium]